MKTILQHFHVVIGLEHEHVRASDTFDDQSRYVTEISEKSDVGSVAAEEKPHRILGIVRHGERFNENVADLETRSGTEEPAIEFYFELFFDRLLGRAIAIDWQSKLLRKNAEALDVIAVLVGDENPRQVFRSATDQRQTLANLSGTEPRIHKNTGLIGFHISAITGGTAAKNRQVNGHRPTVEHARPNRQRFLNASRSLPSCSCGGSRVRWGIHPI
jgi:hypothetical protein